MKNGIVLKKRAISRRTFAKGSLMWLSSLWLRRRLRAEPLNVPVLASRFINPLIGASTSLLLGEGKTFPGPATPFGMVQLSPDTITGGVKGPGYAYEGDNAPGYSYEQTTIEGFSFTHMSGVGWYGDLGNLQMMPTTGPMTLDSGRVDHPGEGWRSTYSHATENTEANYYAVTLDDYGIRAELTAAPHSGMLQFTFPKTETARIQLNLARRIGGTSTHQYVKVVDDRTIEGWMHCPSSGGGWGNGDGHVSYTVYFHTEISKPSSALAHGRSAFPMMRFPCSMDWRLHIFAPNSIRNSCGEGKCWTGAESRKGIILASSRSSLRLTPARK